MISSNGLHRPESLAFEEVVFKLLQRFAYVEDIGCNGQVTGLAGR